MVAAYFNIGKFKSTNAISDADPKSINMGLEFHPLKCEELEAVVDAQADSKLLELQVFCIPQPTSAVSFPSKNKTNTPKHNKGRLH